MIETGSPLRRLLRSAGALAFLNVLSMVAAFAIGVMLARQLGASGYGVYGLAMTVATLAGMVTEFGLPSLNMREVAAASATGDWACARGLERWTNLAILVLSSTILALFAVWLTLGQTDRQSAFVSAMVWAVLLIPVVAIGKVRGLSLLSLGHTMAGQFPVLILRPGLFALALATYWALGCILDAPTALMLQVAAAFFAMMVSSWLWRRLKPSAMRTVKPRYEWRGWVGACVPMGLTEGLRLLQGQGAVLLLGLLATTHDVGIFRVADATMTVVGVGLSILATAATPMFASLHISGDREGLQRLLAATALGMVLSTLVLGAPFVLAGTQIFSLVFGRDFGLSFAPFIIVWLGWVGFALIGPVHTYANMTGRERLTAISFTISITVMAAVGAITVPKYGAIGAAMASSLANILSSFWIWRKIYKIDGVNASVFSHYSYNLISANGVKFLLIEFGKGKMFARRSGNRDMGAS